MKRERNKFNLVTNDSINDIVCDRCGEPAEFADGEGGNCPECGDNLCIGCAGKWMELEDYEESGDLVCESCYDYQDPLRLRFRSRPEHWVDRYLRPLEACTDAMEAAYQYANPREAWENWTSAGDMLWLLGETEHVPSNPGEIGNCLCDMTEHILPVYEWQCPCDDRPRKAIELIRALAVSDKQDSDYTEKYQAVSRMTSVLRRIAFEEADNDAARVATAIDALADCFQLKDSTMLPFEIPGILMSVVEHGCESKPDVEAAVFVADEHHWQCDCVRKYFPGDLFDFEEKYEE